MNDSDDALNQQALSRATATGVTATSPFGMSTRTSLAAVGFTVFDHGIAQADDAQANGASTFHLGHRSHGFSPK